ncbi:GNAT family N-acetyltransferase [Williamsia sp. SKLECPSW1]
MASPQIETVTDVAEAAAVASVAAVTFPLACPPGTTSESTDAFIAATLTPSHFAEHITAPDRDVLVARDTGGAIVGYTLIVHSEPSDPEVCEAIPVRPVTEVSKVYVLESAHGSGIAQALVATSLDRAARRGSVAAWLGVSNVNLRAQRFYTKAGFRIVGRKSFWLGGIEERDYVMLRELGETTPSV